MIDLMPIRNILYDILTADEETSPNVQATQNMGVALTNTLKKEGVTILQMQSVVNKTVLAKVTAGLRLLDGMQLQIDGNQQPTIELKPRTLEDVIGEKLAEGYSLKDFIEMITGMYVNAAIETFGMNRARRQLRVRGETFAKYRYRDDST